MPDLIAVGIYTPFLITKLSGYNATNYQTYPSFENKTLEMAPQGLTCVLSNFTIIPISGVLSKLHNLYDGKHSQVHLS